MSAFPRIRREARVDVAVQVLERLLEEQAGFQDVAIIGCAYDPEHGTVRFYLSGENLLAAAEGQVPVQEGFLCSGGWVAPK